MTTTSPISLGLRLQLSQDLQRARIDDAGGETGIDLSLQVSDPSQGTSLRAFYPIQKLFEGISSEHLLIPMTPKTTFSLTVVDSRHRKINLHTGGSSRWTLTATAEKAFSYFSRSLNRMVFTENRHVGLLLRSGGTSGASFSLEVRGCGQVGTSPSEASKS